MSIFSYQTVKNILFNLNPETAHSLTGLGLKTAPYSPCLFAIPKNHYFVHDSMLEQEVCGITFQNPVGLAAVLTKMESTLKRCQL